MSLDKRTLITVGASTVVGFTADVVIYSLAASKGKKFSFHFPKGMALFNLIWLGIATGLIIDFATKKIDEAQMPPEEKELSDLFEKEKAKISEGLVLGKVPVEVKWA